MEAIREAWRSTTCRSVPASALTGPCVALATSCSSNIVTVPRAYRTAVQVDGGSPSRVRVSCPAAEQRYAAVKGEALAVAWGLEQTRYFTQGSDNLVKVTDHKPLVKIFGDRTSPSPAAGFRPLIYSGP
ncbi:hypothetical protein CesoFtcFv8_015477 [Champsocephalus esox]|uniref:Reverse transcriptase RNase H-like domain-containing protein n=1 Tax=Champsocephalus esox TaxID=159716 RepID=A0AAN8GS33_9TELE|nr:hypothetical protein CesoFtcFv8_015477 [Champsocephalus esox]